LRIALVTDFHNRWCPFIEFHVPIGHSSVM
jgi:hypothetical protein